MAERKTVCKSQISNCKKHLLSGSTVFSFMDEDFLINCDHFLPDSIEILSNEKIEVYPFYIF